MTLVLTVVFTVFAIMVAGAWADDVYVDDDATGPLYNGTPGDPYQRITDALADSGLGFGDTIHVAAGLYNVTDNGETFPLTMIDGVSLSGEKRDTTILDAEGKDYVSYHVIYCDAVNDLTIEGFTVTGGYADGTYPDSGGGGIYCYESSPTISNNTITDNTAYSCGAIFCDHNSSPTISNNTITSNTAEHSCGGILCYEDSSPTIRNNTITDNAASVGGGIYCYYSSPTISNNTIEGNTAYHGGGIYCYKGSVMIENNMISGNTAHTVAGGIYCDLSSPTIKNNTISGNSADTVAGGIYCCYSSSPTVINSILWGDSPNEVYVDGFSSITITYSDIEDGWTGTGNIQSDPLFVGGYYLSQVAAGQASDSPCIDAGSDTAANLDLDDRTTRMDGVDDTGQVDMGYHYDEGSELHHYVDADSGNDTTNNGNSWADAFATIQKGIEDCTDGTCDDPDVIHVAKGTYYENIVLDTNITLLGGYPSGGGARDPAANETIIDGSPGGSVVTIDTKDCVTIDGFTIQNGEANDGGGIFCHDSSPTIQNNTITDNTAHSGSGGIYCYYSSPTITDNTITGNNGGSAGGIYCSHYSSPIIQNNTITGNSASYTGSGIQCYYYSSPTISNSMIAENSASSYGGGIYCAWYSSPTVTNCLITHNDSTRYGGGVFCYYSSPTLTNCTIADNSADNDGESEGEGGAIYCHDSSSAPEVKNCILWGDSPDEIAGDTTNLTVTCCDVDQSGYAGSDGNISKDPGFVPLDGSGTHTGYYLMHLGPQAKNSACIDAGTGTAGDSGVDGMTTCTDGREDTGTIDMGYHYDEGYTGSGDTYIHLMSFEARPENGNIILTWETGVEIDNAGFVLFRNVAGTQDYEQISGLVPARGTSASGAAYSFTDSNVERGVPAYWLVDIDTSGKWTVHGPVSARLPIDLKLIEQPATGQDGKPSLSPASAR